MESARMEGTRAGGAGLVCLTDVTFFSGPSSRRSTIPLPAREEKDQIS